MRSAPTGAEAVLVDLSSGTYFSLNETGAWLWWRLSDGATVESLVSDLAERFGLSEDVARVDVEALIRELEAAGLVEVDRASVPESAPPNP